MNMRIAIAVLSASLSVIWLMLMAERRLPFDVWMKPYWGDGFNPPSINFMIYSIFILFLCYSSFSLLSECKSEIIHKFVSLFCVLGRNTLYIWLYHLLIKSFIADRFPNLVKSSIGIRLLVFWIIVVLPVIKKQLIFGIFKFYDMYIRMEKERHVL